MKSGRGVLNSSSSEKQGSRKETVLRSKKDFVSVLKKGTSRTSRFIALRTISRGLAGNRLGVMASSRVFKTASLRNKIKRRLREAFRKVSADLGTGNDIILIARSGLENQKFSSVEDSINSLFGAAGLLKRR